MDVTVCEINSWKIYLKLLKLFCSQTTKQPSKQTNNEQHGAKNYRRHKFVGETVYVVG